MRDEGKRDKLRRSSSPLISSLKVSSFSSTVPKESFSHLYHLLNALSDVSYSDVVNYVGFSDAVIHFGEVGECQVFPSQGAPTMRVDRSLTQRLKPSSLCFVEALCPHLQTGNTLC